MKNKIKIFIICAFVFGIGVPVLFAGKLESISGKVYEVFASDNEFTMTVNQPDANVVSIMKIQVDTNTAYSGVPSLGTLRLDQPVQVDFSQNSDGNFIAKTLIATPMPEVPKKPKVKASL